MYITILYSHAEIGFFNDTTIVTIDFNDCGFYKVASTKRVIQDSDWFLLRVSTREIFKEDEYVKSFIFFPILFFIYKLHRQVSCDDLVVTNDVSTKLVIRIIWFMSSRVARDSSDPIRANEEALQRRRSWSHAFGRSTGIPRGSISDHDGCRSVACPLRGSSIEGHRIADRIERKSDEGARRCSRPSTINSAATIDISPPTSLARDKIL